MRKFLLFAVAIIVAAPAHAATCPEPGYYLDNGECKICDVGYYCPGDNARHYCSCYSVEGLNPPCYSDTPGATECKPCPPVSDEVLEPNFYWYWTSNDAEENKIHKNVNGCRATWIRTTEHGTVQVSCGHGASGYTQGTSNTKCQVSTGNSPCAAGYAIDRNASYFYTTSTATNLWFSNFYLFIENDFCEPAGIGKYSPDGERYATQCPDGTSTHTDTASSPDACVPLCTNGGKKLHAGDHEFNIWPDGTCSSPSIGIGLPGGACCVNLAPGAGTGINVEWDGNIYHTVN